MPAHVDTEPYIDRGTNSYTNDPRPVYTNPSDPPTNTVEKPGNITYDATANQAEGVDNVRDDRERTVYEWPATAPKKSTAKKK